MTTKQPSTGALRLEHVLADPSLNGVYRITGAIPDQPGILCLDGRSLHDKDRLLTLLGRALDFPAYYGRNWDALEECLNDLSWYPGPVVLCIDHAEAMNADDLATLVDIWGEAALGWGEVGRNFVLLLRGEGLDGLPTLNA